MKDKFKAWMVDSRHDHDKQRASIVELELSDLPPGDVVIEVEYSCLNYKDAAAILGTANILRTDKCVPGIDFAGTVVESESSEFKPGDKVVGNGQGYGEAWHGGLAEYVRAKSSLINKMPDGLDVRQAMFFGTAGFTACMCMEALEQHGVTEGADILVTSVGGGVGGIGAALVASAKMNLHAVTRTINQEYAKSLGATSVIDREEFAASYRPLGKALWDGAIDTAGGKILPVALSQLKPNSMAACCGLTAGAEVNMTVMPFILRGVVLKGVNSVDVEKDDRARIWELAAKHVDVLDKVNTNEIGMDGVVELAQRLITGKNRGRTIIKVKT